MNSISKRRVYRLSYQSDPPRIVMWINSKCFHHIERIQESIPIVKHYMEDLEVDIFIPYQSTGSTWGFGGALFLGAELNDYRAIEARLPRYSMVECFICSGKGTRGYPFEGEKCLCCRGSRETPSIPWRQIMLIRASLQVLFSLYWMEESKENLDDSLIVPELLVRTGGYHSGGVGGVISSEMVIWLQGLSKGGYVPLPDVNTVVEEVWDHMSRLRGYERHRIETYSRDGGLTIDVPGNATGVYMGRGFGGEELGQICCHNMDTGLQQLACLAGLAQTELVYLAQTGGNN